MVYLTKVTETYRADTEEEAMELIEEAKHNNMYVVEKYSNTKKEVKSKGEILDQFQIVSLVKAFNDPKEPTSEIAITYE